MVARVIAPIPALGSAADAVNDGFGSAHGGWLAAAVGLHLAGQVFRGLGWRAVLGTSWPRVAPARACAWYVCGAGLSGVLSARGSDAVRVALAKRALPEASWPALAGTLAAEGSFEALCSIALTLVALALGVGTAHLPSPLVVAAVAGLLGAAALVASRRPRARRLAFEIGRGAAVLRRPRRWLRCVVPWQVAARVVRLGSAACFLLAVGLPVTPAIVLAAYAAQGSGGLLPLGFGPAAVGGALLVAVPLAAGHPLDRAAVSALAVVQPLALTAVGLTTSVALFAALSGARTPAAVVRAARALRPRPAPATP